MTVIRERIFAAIEQRIAAIPGVAEVERMPSGDPISFPALAIYDDGQQTEDEDALAARYTLGVLIEGYVEGGSGAEAHASLNTLYAAVVRALLTEPPLGGLAETIAEGGMRVTVADLAAQRRLGFALDLSITFPTSRFDPAVLA